MQVEAEKKAIAKQLQAKINAMQGLGKPSIASVPDGFAPFDMAFPGRIFPKAAIHEFVSYQPTQAAATTGFITALAGKIMKDNGLCLWVSSDKKIFPAGLNHFGLAPDRVVFISTAKPKDKLWIIEEALKCEALTVVVGEMKELGFTESRRLQLAVERSGVTGFIHRYWPHSQNAVACTTRWSITPTASIIPDGLPGVGYSCWDIQLLKVRNGKPGAWQVGWRKGQFIDQTHDHQTVVAINERHAG
ncbi:MAG TPA: hypothetical protein PLS51_04435 [Flavobacterium sp.]|nr:hypothetical protein [Flavobacterium sp.]HPJ09853.1 hypothetical protein [Flavobacterium sp.]